MWNEAKHPRDENGRFTEKDGPQYLKNRKGEIIKPIRMFKIDGRDDDFVETVDDKGKNVTYGSSFLEDLTDEELSERARIDAERKATEDEVINFKAENQSLPFGITYENGVYSRRMRDGAVKYSAWPDYLIGGDNERMRYDSEQEAKEKQLLGWVEDNRGPSESASDALTRKKGSDIELFNEEYGGKIARESFAKMSLDEKKAYLADEKNEDLIFKDMDEPLYEEFDPITSKGGYDGNSMSNRARRAYDSGQMPMSKWKKEDVLERMEGIDELEPYMDELRGLSEKTLKDNFLEKAAWHHSSKFFNKTDFYGVVSPKDIVSNLRYLRGSEGKTFSSFGKK